MCNMDPPGKKGCRRGRECEFAYIRNEPDEPTSSYIHYGSGEREREKKKRNGITKRNKTIGGGGEKTTRLYPPTDPEAISHLLFSLHCILNP